MVYVWEHEVRAMSLILFFFAAIVEAKGSLASGRARVIVCMSCCLLLAIRFLVCTGSLSTLAALYILAAPVLLLA